MAFEGMMLGVYHVPKIEIDSGTDWVTLLGFALTALAVAAGSYVTMWTFKRTAKGQEELARKVSLKQSRQEWINDLRSTAAEFVASMMILQSIRGAIDNHNEQILALRLEDRAAAIEAERGVIQTLAEVRSKAFALRARLLLLSNPAEQDFINMAAIIEECMVGAEIDRFNIMDPCNELTSIVQGILKKEWERAKALT